MADTYRMNMAKKIRRLCVDEFGGRPNLELCAVLFDKHKPGAVQSGYRKDEEFACYVFDLDEETLRLSAKFEPQNDDDEEDLEVTSGEG